MRTNAGGAIVIGAGLAGLTAALKLSPLQVTVLSKTPLGSGAASDWAQGGIAAAIGPDDSPQLHSQDTLRAGGGIADANAIDLLTATAPNRIAELLELGASFDRTPEGTLALGQEAAHNRRRIVHAHGDATGHELMSTLIEAIRQTPSVRVVENALAEDLIVENGAVTGVTASDATYHAGAVILATGGIGRLYRYTTNPIEATADGLAMAARAGAVLSDLEFVQFHPTALDAGMDPMPLVTEAIRGEGATLIDELGDEFVEHPDAELASRDILAREIFYHRARGHKTFLDARTAIGERFAGLFPTVFAACRAAGIDPRTQPIPIAPAEHYHIGGVAVDRWGRTSLAGLWACGEVSASGVHGANRLASNSLLEALVYGARVATDIKARARLRPVRSHPTGPSADSIDESASVAALRNLMYERVGLVRNADGLTSACEEIARIESEARSLELRNLSTAGRLIAQAALSRPESRGSHFRSDYASANPEYAKRSFTPAGSLAR